LNIAVLADRLELGGVETHILSQVNELLLRGHKVLLSSVAVYQELLEKLKAHPNFEYIPFDERYVDRCREFRPDLIHAHPFQAIIEGHKLAKILDIPFFVTVHGPYDYGLDRSPLGYQVCTTVKRIIAVNLTVASFLLNGTAHPEKVSVIRNGIDLKEFPVLSTDKSLCREYGLDPEWFTSVVISRFGDGKERPIRQLLRVSLILAEKLKGWNLVLVGDGPFITSLEKEAEGLQHPLLRIKFVGRQTEVRKFLQMADLVFASGRAALEAMACQRPVFAMNSPGFGSLVDLATHTDYIFRRWGYEFPADEELVKRIASSCQEEKLNQAAFEGHMIVKKHYNLFETTTQLERVYYEYTGKSV